MALTAAQYDDLANSTLADYTKDVVDNISKHIPLWDFMNEKGNIKMKTGGQAVFKNLNYRENSSVDSYDNYELLDTSRQESTVGAQFEWKQYCGHFLISGKEMLVNRGEDEVFDLIDNRAKVLVTSMESRLAADMLLDGTGNGGRNLGGLALLISRTPTLGTVGGLDRSLAINSFWRNQKFDAVVDGGAPVSSTNIESYISTIIQNSRLNGKRADVMYAGGNMYRLLKTAIRASGRYMLDSDKKLKAGIDGFTYEGLKVIDASGIGSTMDPNIAYFIHSGSLYLEIMRGQNFDTLMSGGDRKSFNQDAIIKYIGWMGTMTTDQPRLNTIFFDSSL